MSGPNLYLVGLMAVGKTTVGRLLADSLHMEFFDSDHEIEARAGADTSWIFDMEGEEGFRDREQQVIDDLTQRKGIVLATGGGAVLRAENRQALASRGIVLHLDSPLDRLVERTKRDKRRPLLQHGDVRKTLARLMTERNPLYAEVRDYRFVTDRQSAKVFAKKIEARLRADDVLK